MPFLFREFLNLRDERIDGQLCVLDFGRHFRIYFDKRINELPAVNLTLQKVLDNSRVYPLHFCEL